MTLNVHRVDNSVGTSMRKVYIHAFKFAVGATGAVGTVIQGGGLAVASVVRASAGLYTVTLNNPQFFNILNFHPQVHPAAVADPALRCSYVPGSLTTSAAGVVTFQFRCTADTAVDNTLQAATDPTSGSEVHVKFLEIRDTEVDR